MPICWYATFDWEFTKETLLEKPSTYAIGLNNECFNPLQFWKSYAIATAEALLLTYLTVMTFNEIGMSHGLDFDL